MVGAKETERRARRVEDEEGGRGSGCDDLKSNDPTTRVGEKTLNSTLREFLNMPKRRPNNQTSSIEFIELLKENSFSAST